MFVRLVGFVMVVGLGGLGFVRGCCVVIVSGVCRVVCRAVVGRGCSWLCIMLLSCLMVGLIRWRPW